MEAGLRGSMGACVTAAVAQPHMADMTDERPLLRASCNVPGLAKHKVVYRYRCEEVRGKLGVGRFAEGT